MVSSTISASSRSPAPLIEPIFQRVFNLSKETIGLLNPGDLRKKTDETKESTIAALLTNTSPRLCHRMVGRIYMTLDSLLFINEKLPVRNPCDVIQEMPTSTSSAYPDFITPKSSNRSRIIAQIYYMLSTHDFSCFTNYFTVISWRVQQRPSGTKYRIFFPVPQLIQVSEYMFASAWFSHLRVNKNTPYCFGHTYEDLKTKYVGWQKYKYIYSLDYSSYDLSIPRRVLSYVFEYIRRNTKFSSGAQVQLFNQIEKFHLKGSVIIYVQGLFHIISKANGLYSGSSLTNFLGTLVNMFIIVYFCQWHKIPVTREMFAVMGDDTILCLNTYYSLGYMKKFFKEHFGINISLEKSKIFKSGEKVFFLGHYFDDSGRYLDFDLTKRQLVISESFIPESKISTEMRIISKFCSLCFKCSDGHVFYHMYIDKIKELLNISKLPKYYLNLIAGSDGYLKPVEINYAIYESWRKQ